MKPFEMKNSVLINRLFLAFIISFFGFSAYGNDTKIDNEGREVIVEPNWGINSVNAARLYKGPRGYTLEFTGTMSLVMNVMTPLSIALEKIPEATNFNLVLDSEGGVVLVNYYFRKKLMKKCNRNGVKICSITTIVKKGDICDSACVGLFMVGDTRLLEDGAQLGFHAAGSRQEGIDAGFMEELLIQWGVSESWVREQEEKGIFSRFEMTYYFGDELMDSRSNITTTELPVGDILKKAP